MVGKRSYRVRAKVWGASFRQHSSYWLAGTLWLICGCFGFWFLLDHGIYADGAKGIVKDPNDGLVSRCIAPIRSEDLEDFVPQQGTLHVVMALHPKCPCTRNTLVELQQLLTIDPFSTRCTFLLALPQGEAISWMDTGTARLAKSLPNSQMLVDIDATRSRQLGLRNSGAMLVVQSDRTVAFCGGITAGRSCVAANPGSETVAKLFRHESVVSITTPTFGCPLN